MRRRDEAQLIPLRLFLQLVEGLVLTLLELLVDLAEAAPVAVALECGRDRAAQFVDEPHHVAPQRAAAAARQRHGDRLAVVVEVVEIAPVERLGALRGV